MLIYLSAYQAVISPKRAIACCRCNLNSLVNSEQMIRNWLGFGGQMLAGVKAFYREVNVGVSMDGMLSENFLIGVWEKDV